MSVLPGTNWTKTTERKPACGVVVIGYFETGTTERVKIVVTSFGSEWWAVTGNNRFKYTLSTPPIYWVHTPVNEYA